MGWLNIPARGILPVGLLLLAAGFACDDSDPAPAPTPQLVTVSDADIDPLLDGTAELQPEALGELAKERALLGARWLTGVVRDDGSFYYKYYPGTDEYEEDDYNEVRHAGTLYSMYYVYGVSRDAALLSAADRALEWIDEAAVTVPDGSGRAVVYEDVTKLGTQGLAIVALLERRRVTGESDHDELISDLAEFLLSMEIPDEPGRYYGSYDADFDERLLEPESAFYPGEALLALTRLAEHFPDGPYLEYAIRSADYLVHERDGDIPDSGEIPREDHWLAMALSELYRLEPDEGYKTVAYLHADSMVDNQWKADEGDPALIGGTHRSNPISFTSTATKGEALVAVWSLAKFAGDEDEAERYAEGTLRNVQFQIRVQYTPENTALYPDPSRIVGGWGRDAVENSVRIDYVQHNISALIGAWHMTTEGDLPHAATGSAVATAVP